MSEQFNVRFKNDKIACWDQHYLPYLDLKNTILWIEKNRNVSDTEVQSKCGQLVTEFRDGIKKAEQLASSVLFLIENELNSNPSFSGGKLVPSSASSSSSSVANFLQNISAAASSSAPRSSADSSTTSQNSTIEMNDISVSDENNNNGESKTNINNNNNFQSILDKLRENENEQQKSFFFSNNNNDDDNDDQQQQQRKHPLDSRLEQLKNLYFVATKVFRFVELNRNAATRLVLKYDFHVFHNAHHLNFFDQEESSTTTTSNNNENQKQQDLFEKIETEFQEVARNNNLNKLNRVTDSVLCRIISVAHSLFNENTVMKHFQMTTSKKQKDFQQHWTIKWRWILVAFVCLIVFLAIPVFSENKHAHNCLALLVTVSVLWVSEAIPFFVSAIGVVPLLAVSLNVLPGLNHSEAGKKLLSATFDHTQILVIGALSCGQALQKHKMENTIAEYCLKPLAHRPRLFVLVLMLLTTAFCGVLSNVAVPVLVLNVILPILHRTRHSDGVAQMILLAVAFAANVGGALTPVSSPQAAVALKALGKDSVTFSEFLIASLPLVLLCVVVAWIVLLLLYDPFPENYVLPVTPEEKTHSEKSNSSSSISLSSSSISESLLKKDKKENENENSDVDPTSPRELNYVRKSSQTSRLKNNNNINTIGSFVDSEQEEEEEGDRVHLLSQVTEKAVIIITIIVTILMWMLPKDGLLGDAGIVSLIPITVFYGTGILSKDSFHSLSWPLLFLLSGGNVLGICVSESGLLKEIVSAMHPFFVHNSPFVIIMVLMILIACVATLVSHTVSAIILMPAIVQIAVSNQNLPSSQALVFLSVTMCSCAQAFPITSFPNIVTLFSEDQHGDKYLKPTSYFLPGGVVQLVALVSMFTWMPPMCEAIWAKPI